MSGRPGLAAVLLTLLAAAGAAGCGDDPPSPDVIARVGPEQVLYASFSEYVETETESSIAALESPVLSHLLDQYLTELLLVRAAIDRGLVEPGTGHREALAALLASAPAEDPPRSEVLARFRAERERLNLPERVRVSQILTETREEAQRAVAELESGADFADVARRYSTDPSAPYGGDQGELSREDLPEEFAEVIFSLQPGEVSDIVEAAYGFHVFRVTARLPSREVSFAEAEPELAAELREEHVRAWLDRVVEETRSRYTVRVYERNLPFEYQGDHASHDLSTEP